MQAGAAASHSGAARWRRVETIAASPSVPAATAVAEPQAAAQSTSAFPFFIFCIYTFVLFGRPQDYVTALVPLRLAMVFTLLTVAITLMTLTATKMRNPFLERETRLYFVFFVVMIAGIPFSFYRPGSFDQVIMKYVVNIAFFLLFLIHVDTVPKLRRVAVVLVLSVLVFTVFSLRYGQFGGGRYSSGVMMFDPNDIAFVEVSLLSFAVWVLVGSFGLVTKLLALVTVMSGVLLALYTGSRGGLLGLLTFLLLFLMLRIPRLGKSFKTVMMIALVVAAMLNADKINIDRYMTLTSLEGDYNFEEGGRSDIWKRGVRLFFQYPITGVGVNGFPAAIGGQRLADGAFPKWQTAHSAYIQVLTETGVFGSISFLLLITTSLATFNRLRRRGGSSPDRDFGMLPGLLLIGFAAQLVSAAFLSQAYSMFFTLTFALSAAMNRIASSVEPTAPVTAPHSGEHRVANRPAINPRVAWSR